MNYAIEYLADSKIIEVCLKDSMYKTAQAAQSVPASIASTVREYVLSKFKKDEPIASIVSFLGPGIIWKISPTFAIFYELASAFGFDWPGFWRSVGENLEEFLQAIFYGNHKPTETELSQKVDTAVDTAAQTHFINNPNQGLIANLAKKLSYKEKLKDVIEVKAVVDQYRRSGTIIKNAALYPKLIKLLVKIIKWVVKTAFVSLGLTAGAGVIKGLLDSATNSSGEQNAQYNQQPSENIQAEPSSYPTVSIPMSENVSPELTQWHKNDMRTAWIERGDSNQIPNMLMSWVLNAYPQLQNYSQQLMESNSFRSVLQKFENRNKFSEGLGIYSIPHPYQRKIDMVNEIVSGFLRESPQAGREINQQDHIDYK